MHKIGFTFCTVALLTHVFVDAIEPPFRFSIPFFPVQPSITTAPPKITTVAEERANITERESTILVEECSNELNSTRELTTQTVSNSENNEQITTTVKERLDVPNTLIKSRSIRYPNPRASEHNSCESQNPRIYQNPYETTITPPNFLPECQNLCCPLKAQTPCQFLTHSEPPNMYPMPCQYPCYCYFNNYCKDLPNKLCNPTYSNCFPPNCQRSCCLLNNPCRTPPKPYQTPCNPTYPGNSPPHRQPQRYPNTCRNVGCPLKQPPLCISPCCSSKEPCQIRRCTRRQSSRLSRFFKSITSLFNVRIQMDIPISNEYDCPKVKLQIREGSNPSAYENPMCNQG